MFWSGHKKAQPPRDHYQRDYPRAQYRQLVPAGATGSILDHDPRDEEKAIDFRDRETMIATLRRLSNENSLIKGIVKRIKDNDCGPAGPTLQCESDDNDYNDELENWWDTAADTIDVRGVLSFGQIVRLMDSEQLLAGDLGFVKLDRGQVQAVEADRICSPCRTDRPGQIVQGVEFSPSTGRPLRYHVRKGPDRDLNLETTPVPAENFIHHFDPERFDQVRGVAGLLASLDNIRDLDQYMMAEKTATIAASMFGSKWKTKYPDDDPNAEHLADYLRDEPKDGRRPQPPRLTIGKAMQVNCGPNEDFELLVNERPGTQFSPFVEMVSRFVGVGVGIPLELVLLDFKKANFSGIRGIMMEAQKTFEARREPLRLTAMKLFRHRHEYALKAKELPPPPKNLRWKITLQWPGWAYVNPGEEVTAAKNAIDAGLSSEKIECAKLGRDWCQIAKDKKKVLDFYAANGIPYVSGLPGSSVNSNDKQRKDNPDEE